MCATVIDYPDVPQRGLVEGYYGNPYSEENRMGLFEMFGRQKMNVYIYGPKDDAYHKSKWRQEYPADLAAKITGYVNAAKANKVEFVWAIHPGEDIQWNQTDRNNIVNKLKAHLQECERGEGEKYKVSWKTQTRSIFDSKKFIADHPEMDVSKYFKTTNLRPFKVTEKKGNV
jgi:predicted phage-related endonuclease